MVRCLHRCVAASLLNSALDLCRSDFAATGLGGDSKRAYDVIGGLYGAEIGGVLRSMCEFNTLLQVGLKPCPCGLLASVPGKLICYGARCRRPRR